MLWIGVCGGWNPGTEPEAFLKVTAEVSSTEPDCLLIRVGDSTAPDPDPAPVQHDDRCFVHRDSAYNGIHAGILSVAEHGKLPPEEQAKYFPVEAALPRIEGPNWLAFPSPIEFPKAARITAAGRNRAVSEAMTPVVEKLDGTLPAGSMNLESVLTRLSLNHFKHNNEVVQAVKAVFSKRKGKLAVDTAREVATKIQAMFKNHFEPVVRPSDDVAKRIARNLDKSGNLIKYFKANPEEYKFAEYFADPANYLKALAGARAEDLKARSEL